MSWCNLMIWHIKACFCRVPLQPGAPDAQYAPGESDQEVETFSGFGDKQSGQNHEAGHLSSESLRWQFAETFGNTLTAPSSLVLDHIA